MFFSQFFSLSNIISDGGNKTKDTHTPEDWRIKWKQEINTFFL